MQLIDIIVNYLKINPNRTIRTICRELSVSQSKVKEILYQHPYVFEFNSKNNTWSLTYSDHYYELNKVVDSVLGEIRVADYTQKYLDYFLDNNYRDNELSLFERVDEVYPSSNLLINYGFSLPQIRKLNTLNSISFLDFVYLIKYKLSTRTFYNEFNNFTDHFKSEILMAFDILREKLIKNYYVNLKAQSSEKFFVDRNYINNNIFLHTTDKWTELIGENDLTKILNISKFENLWLFNIKLKHLKFYFDKKRLLIKLITFLDTKVSNFLEYQYGVLNLWDKNIHEDILKLPTSVLCNYSDDQSINKLLKLMEEEFEFTNLKDFVFFHSENLYMLRNVKYNDLISFKYKLNEFIRRDIL